MIKSMKYTFDNIYVIEFANKVLARLDRLLNIRIDHSSTFLKSSRASYVDDARSKMLCSSFN